ncbi:HAD-superfamily hydrolase, subfamily IIA [Aciduliprofundum boonei T469]|uniref:HAD-superfamily hydrolase, subfamily IIA n=2 Tax=Candidatus Aciduliprofundum boonei TaxID=379547 RepID=D3TA64_ACIB4|nr:HAD-superfamily hydrolase, subfamily IIA [Aciduliprofundum boonei T469]
MHMKFVIDMDGVLYRGNRKIEGADTFIKFLQDNSVPFLLATNNSTKTREMYVEKLKNMGIKVKEKNIITSAYVTAEVLKKEENRASALIIGEIGIFEEIKRIGWGILDLKNWSKAEYVIVGMDTTLTYEKLKAGCLAINNGAKFIATNDDKNFPSEEGLIPGAGSMVAALEAATGKKARVMGKPNEPYVNMIKSLLGSEDIWVVGDRIETDMLLAEKLGAKKVLVLSGVTKEPVKNVDYVINDVGRLPALLASIL